MRRMVSFTSISSSVIEWSYRKLGVWSPLFVCTVRGHLRSAVSLSDRVGRGSVSVVVSVAETVGPVFLSGRSAPLVLTSCTTALSAKHGTGSSVGAQKERATIIQSGEAPF